MREVGKCSPILMAVTRELLGFVDKWQMTLRPCYLHGIANIEANVPSRDKKVIKWSLQPDVTAKLFRVLGHHEIDLLTSVDNTISGLYAQLERLTSTQP